ncbi:hypothetical protein [Pseudoxanthomonas sp. JBR18]|uniref:hypothetical protein n=1 Tax=Pseudoxanthomonas sp. JBR18 TaxID=2969308 RepID=UPI002304F824|nr:hypothetical protein [Pseudoxanthomonas sp. JBR18]WCE03471.1 hypothetical protein PJ250_15415 [Pseudoxanthomonas sp. JBR18]
MSTRSLISRPARIALSWLLAIPVSICANTTQQSTPEAVTADVHAFWGQLRQALLDADAIARPSGGHLVTFHFDVVDIERPCERKALEAHLRRLLDWQLASGKTWRTFLKEHPTLNLRSGSCIYWNTADEVPVALQVRFDQLGPDGQWQVTDLLHDGDDLFRYSAQAGGPSDCGPGAG